MIIVSCLQQYSKIIKVLTMFCKHMWLLLSSLYQYIKVCILTDRQAIINITSYTFWHIKGVCNMIINLLNQKKNDWNTKEQIHLFNEIWYSFANFSVRYAVIWTSISLNIANIKCAADINSIFHSQWGKKRKQLIIHDNFWI